MATEITRKTLLSFGRLVRVLVPTTSTALLTVPVVGRNRILTIRPYLSVVTNAANVTLSAAWTDPDFGADTYTWFSAQNLSPGTYPVVALTVLGQVGTTLILTAQASLANTVRLSVDVEGV
jgi:hypothetical protein